MEYKLLSPGDLKQIIPIIHNSIEVLNSPDYLPSEIAVMKKYQTIERLQTKMAKGAKFFLALENEKIVGIGGIENSYVSTVFIDPDYAGRGIGKKIMELLEQNAKDDNQTELGLGSSVTARGFYEKLGYRMVKEQFLELDNLKIKMYLMIKKLKVENS